MASETERQTKFGRLVQGLANAGGELLPGPLKAAMTGANAFAQLSSAADMNVAIAALEAEQLDAILDEFATALAGLDEAGWEHAMALATLRQTIADLRAASPAGMHVVNRDSVIQTQTNNNITIHVIHAERATPPGIVAPGLGPDPIEVDRYLQKIQAQHGRIRLLGFTNKVRLSPRLQDIYIPLDTGLPHAESPGQKDAEALGASEDRLPLADAFKRTLGLGRRAMVLLGDPGSGKTTYLKQVLLIVAGDPTALGLPAGCLPVFLSLRKLGALRKSPNPAAVLPEFIRAQARESLLGMTDDFAAHLCKRGNLILLLDGLDEVADANERDEVARWIEKVQDVEPTFYFLVSCRHAGYSPQVRFQAAFRELKLRDLTDPQMEGFVRDWYKLVERELHSDSDQTDARAKLAAEDLMRELARSEFTSIARVYALTRNPLLLTAICLVHHDIGKLPHARAKLYEECVAVLLKRWEDSRTDTLDSDETLVVLQPVAAWMHAERRERATKAELLGRVADAIGRLRDPKPDADCFLDMIRDDVGLLSGWGVDEYGFMHLGFQEFLTAQHLRNVGTEFDRVAGHFADSWWQEVILLMLALHNPGAFDPFMRALVRRPEFTQWWDSPMMQSCFTEASMPSAAAFLALLREPEPRGWLVRKLGLRPDKAKEHGQRQLAAAQLLSRVMPGELDKLADELREHPSPAVREWWATRGAPVRVIGAAATRKVVHGVELVLIPGGDFMMGSPPTEQGRYHAEGPQHRVELASFYLARTPVTNAQYSEYLADPNAKARVPESWADRQYNQPQQPVVGVSWADAQAYCEWAGLMLPTEAQWEYACRAKSTTRYSSGNSERDLDRVGWHRGNSGGRLHTVAEKEANDFGLYDMHGNVWEWCRDAFGPYSTPPVGDEGLRHEPVGDADRVLRGGSGSFSAHFARSAYRDLNHPGYRFPSLGFRPAQAHP